MADYSCDWCNKEDICKYAYENTDCVPSEQLGIANTISKSEYESFQVQISNLKMRNEDVFGELIQALQNIVNNYPDDEDLEYAKMILS